MKEADFVGKEAHLRQREEEPAAVLCTLTVDDHTSSSGRQALHARPRAGARRATASRWSTRTGAARTSRRPGAGPSLGKHILMSYLPPEQATVGEQLQVEFLGEQYPVTVDVVGSTPIFDPENTRIRS